MDPVISVDDPRRADVTALLQRHLDFAHEVTPAGHVHALDIDGLLDPAVLFFSARVERTLLGVGALKQIGAAHSEIKSMHTAAEARGQGIGRAIVEHLLDIARARGDGRVSLETGTMEAFAPARALYLKLGFEVCEPFGDYKPVPNSVCMTLQLGGERGRYLGR